MPDYPHLHANHLLMIRVDKAVCGIDRDTFMEQLKAVNIGTGLHFRAAHTQKYYGNGTRHYHCRIRVEHRDIMFAAVLPGYERQ